MSRRTIGLVLLALASITLGLVTGTAFFGLFRSTVPPSAIGTFQVGAAQFAFLTYGLVLGIVVFAFEVVVLLLAPLFRRSSAKEPKADRTSG